MLFLIRFILFVYLLWIGTYSFLFATTVKIFDIGQGNAVGIEHHDEGGKRVIIVDAGSSKYNHMAFHQENASSTEETNFLIENKKLVTKETEETSSSPREGVSQKKRRIDLPTFQKEESISGQGSSPESQGIVSDGTAQAHKESVLEGMIKFIWEDGTRRIDFIGTHSDMDHVDGSYLEDIFLTPLLGRISEVSMTPITGEDIKSFEDSKLESIKGSNPIKSVVLGGFKKDYNEKTLDVLEILKKLETRVIFTGSYNGEGNNASPFPSIRSQEGAYARGYSSLMPPGILRSPIEKEIEDILKFEGGLKAEILAMNAGFVEVGESIIIANPSPNVNSMVLRFQIEGGFSFLISGDAEEPTWAFIDVMNKKRTDGGSLETDYFLVSHHGSKEKGATSREVLEFFKPKVILLSAGARYHHPSSETIDLIKNYLEGRLETDIHDITYFRPISLKKEFYEYHRLTTRLPIFSTITGGTLTFKLDAPSFPGDEPINVTTSRHKVPTFQMPEGEIFIARGFEVFSSEEKMEKWMRSYETIKKEKIIIMSEEKKGHWKRRNTKSKSNQLKVAESRPQIKKLTAAESESAPGPASPDLVIPDDQEAEHVIVREKTMDDKQKWILYFVDPIEKGQEGALL